MFRCFWRCSRPFDGDVPEDQFRRFMFDNPARFYLETNPRFFEGTVVAGDASAATVTSVA